MYGLKTATWCNFQVQFRRDFQTYMLEHLEKSYALVANHLLLLCLCHKVAADFVVTIFLDIRKEFIEFQMVAL